MEPPRSPANTSINHSDEASEKFLANEPPRCSGGPKATKTTTLPGDPLLDRILLSFLFFFFIFRSFYFLVFFFFFCFYFFHLVLRPLELAWFIAKKINGYVNPPEQALPSPSSLLRFIDAPNQYIRNKREINGGKLVILTVPR